MCDRNRIAKSIVFLAIAWILFVGQAVTAQVTSRPVTAFVHVAVVPMDSERVLFDQTVLVRAGHITAIGPGNSVHIPTHAVRVEGRGKFLMPGLADMHVHLSAQDYETAHQDSAGMERELLLLLSHGVTVVRNMDFSPVGGIADGRLLRLKQRVVAGKILGPRIYTSGPWNGNTVGRAQDASHAIPLYKAAGYDFIKIHDEDRETLDSVAAVAHRIDIPIVGHLPPGVGLHEALGQYHSIEHLMGMYDSVSHVRASGSDTADRLSARAIAELSNATRRAGVWNCPTESVIDSVENDIYGPNGGGTGSGNIDTPLRRQIIKGLQEAGAKLLLGTDEPALTGLETQMEQQGLHVHPTGQPIVTGSLVSKELQALVRAGLTPYQALLTGTRNVAEYLNALDTMGTVTMGKRADLVLLEGNPLTDVGYAAKPSGVMIGGQWLSKADLDRLLHDKK